MKIIIELDNANDAINALSVLSRISENNKAAALSPLPPEEVTASKPPVPAPPVTTAVPDTLPEAGGTKPDTIEPEHDDAVLVDARGFPWDERIHSSNKKQTSAGVWQKRRGVNATLVATVEAELSGVAPEAPAPTPAPAAPVAAPAPQPAAPAVPAPSVAGAVPAPAVGGQGVADTGGGGEAPATYDQIVNIVQEMLTANPEMANEVVEVVSKHAGTPNLGELEGATPEVRRSVLDDLEALANG